MLVWGLTGGIASGKSTVAGYFAARGLAVLNADTLYHDLLQPQDGLPSPLSRRIAHNFSALTLLRDDGSLDRATLGKLVFRDADARQQLEALTHPAIAAAMAAALEKLAQAGHRQALYDVPLLFEKQLQARFAGIVLVWVPEALQLARLQQRDQLSAAAAQQRLSSQLPLASKRAAARWIIDNSGSLAQTEQQVKAVLVAMQQAGGSP